MIYHYLLLTYRTFKRFKSSFFINLIGLSSGLACALLIYLWVMDELKMDQFHEKNNRLFQVMEQQKYENEIMTTNSTPGILAENLPLEIPEIEYATVTTWVNSFTLSIGAHSIKADGYYVGKDFFNIFSYPILAGDPDKVLDDKKSIVISDELANRLFGTTENVVGKVVEWQHKEEFMITGLFEHTPAASSYQFDFVLSFERFKDDNDWVLSWGNNGPSTYITLYEGSKAEDVSAKLKDFIKARHEQSNVTLFITPYADRYLYGHYENGQLAGGRIEYVQLFSLIAVFILLIACINFMNLSTARASRRVKEIGIKKTVGAKQNTLITQFLIESFIVTALSMIVALLLVWLVLPTFNTVTEKNIALQPGPGLLLALVGICACTALLAGSYPALYLSRFKPSRVLKGEVRGSIGELWARRGLVVFQFTLSVILIVSVLVVHKQIHYVLTKNIGYNKDNLIHFRIEGEIEKKRETFLKEVRQIPGVLHASCANQSMTGRYSNTSGVEWEGKSPDELILFENVRVDYDFLETLGVTMKEGRFFSREFGADTARIIFNEKAIDVMGLENPIGKVIRLGTQRNFEIVGVVKDFHFQSMHDAINPLFFRLDPDETWQIMVKIAAGRERETLEKLEDLYHSFNPGFAFEYEFMDNEFRKQYKAEQRVAFLSRYFAAFAILISCLGLFGLATFTAERRVKEIGIRKALGSSAFKIVLLLSGDFTRMVLMAILIALPFSYLLVRSWLDRFAFHIDLEIWFFIGAGVLAMVIAWLSVGAQAIRAASVNPARCLRAE